MELFEQALGDIQGGRVLDVATGQGGFVELLEIEAPAQALRRRLRQVGAQSEPRIVIVGQKPW